ncbi:hypothetical protein L3V77_17425 [Vibrio sp. DW001]|uniref:hypothetical protein n=1 Tax=Vibrio sp. DW001 TaxID=2912315 RepID=UPI0023AF6ED9|nr:hypothetical protein [Vibrio sp. DW001]WED29212.1 hypothetical protein L3V77_17425 [Vibrio sp. DW001]
MRWCSLILLLMSGSVFALEKWETALPLPESIKQTLLLIDKPETTYYEHEIAKLKGWAGDCFKELDENKETDDAGRPIFSKGYMRITYSVPDNRAIAEFSGHHAFLRTNWFNCKLSDSELAKINAQVLRSLESAYESEIKDKKALSDATKQWNVYHQENWLYATVMTMDEDKPREWFLGYDTETQKMFIWLTNPMDEFGAPIGSHVQKGYLDFCNGDKRKIKLPVDAEAMGFEILCIIDEKDGQWIAQTILVVGNEQDENKLIQKFKSKNYVNINNMRISAKGFTKAYSTIATYHQ